MKKNLFIFQKLSINLSLYDNFSFDIKSSAALKHHSDSTEENGIESRQSLIF